MSEPGEITDAASWEDANEEAVLRRYQTLVNTIDDGIYQLDTEGRFVAVNDVIVERVGYGREQLVGEHVSLLLDDAEIERVNGVIRDLLEPETDSVATLELPLQTSDGNTLVCELRMSVLAVDGEYQGTVGVARDITERREREQERRRERTLLDRVFEASPIGISALAPDGEIITINDRAAEMVGSDPDGMVGETYEASDWDVYDADGEPIPPAEQPFGRVVETGEPVTDFEAQVDHLDGGRVWLSFNGVPVPDSEGELSLVVVTYEDITERKEREQQLQRERSQTQKLLETAPVAISVHDADGDTLLANRRAQDSLGLSESKLIEEPDDIDDWSVFDASGDSLPPDETPSARVLASGEAVFDEEIAIEPPGDERLWFRVNAAPVFGSDGALERVISAGEDVTELKQRERQLERRKDELETELSEILGRISDAFYALDEEYRFTHVNERAEELLQHSEAELLGERLWELFPEAADQEMVSDAFHTAMETQEPTSYELYFERLEFWVEAQLYPSETGVSVYFRDATARKERERELAQYEAIVETINDGIYVADEDGRFTMVNEAFAELAGYSRDELLGGHASLIVDETTLERAAEVREVMADENAVTPTLEAPIQTADGGHVSTEVTFATLSSGDAMQERVGVVRDVTERKEQQQRLEESERRYRTLIDHFPNGAVGLFDENLQYTVAGGEMFDELGLSREEVVDTSVYDWYPDDLVEEVEPCFRAVFEGETNTFEVEYHDRDLFGYTLPVENGDGEVFAGMLMVQDITERKEYQRDLEESNERLEQFAYAASHDLQEPLRMVSSYLQLLDRRYGDDLDEDAAEFIDYAVDGAERMREMIDALLEYSRIDTRGDPFEPVDLDAVFEDGLKDLRMRIEESGAEITADSLPSVEGDEGQLRRVFQNLLTNAIEYSGDEPPQVHVSAERDGRNWRIAVSDEGVGIETEHTDRIFEVFQRLHSHDEHAGTGIGLALCRRIIERHGGHIWVESEPGEGSTFFFTIPAEEGQND